MIAVDERVGFITGLCIGRMWVGVPEKNIAPWRDTGVEVRGCAVADIERAFAQVWTMLGLPLPEHELVGADGLAPAGDMSVRIVASVPATAGLFRVDQLVAALARHRLWLTDAYYAGTTSYVQALRMEAMCLQDLANATEIVLDEKRKLRAPGEPRHPRPVMLSGGGSGGRAAAGAIRIGNAVGAAFTGRRALEPVEARIMVTTGVLLLVLATLFALFPRLLVYPLTFVLVWIAATLLYRGYRLRRVKVGAKQERSHKNHPRA